MAVGARALRVLCASLFFALLVAGCASAPPEPATPFMTKPPAGKMLRTQRPYQINNIWYYPIPSAEGFAEEGMASWYGTDFHGKPTSCGEPYDMWAMTAAHKTLPLGTHVKVTHKQTGKTVIVRVNDRGPFVSGRVIDLSCRAAQELGSARTGLAPVRVEAVQVASQEMVGKDTYWKVDPVPSFRYGSFTVQIGAFKEQQNAYRLKDRMAQGYREIQVTPTTYADNFFYRVQVGLYRDIMVAQQEMARLKQQGFGDAFVVAMEGK
jgi:rare lipoprotein A